MQATYEVNIEEKLRGLSRSLALDSLRLVRSVQRELTSDVLARQLVRCATSVGANYRAACRARSRPDMAAKLAIVEEECDECLYWLDLMTAESMVTSTVAQPIVSTAEEILRLVVASRKTLRGVNAGAVREERTNYLIFEEDLPQAIS